MKNLVFKEFLPSPLCNPVTIIQIYTSSHYTILLVENVQYYYYDSLGTNNPVSEIVPKIHSALQISYEDNYEAFPLILQNPEQKAIRETCPLQRDKLSCGNHMLMITLATIYQGKKLDLYYTREDAYFVSQANLHHELTGELLQPCVGRVVDLLTNLSSKNVTKKGKKRVSQPLSSSKNDSDTVDQGASQTTLLWAMVCTASITHFARL